MRFKRATILAATAAFSLAAAPAFAQSATRTISGQITVEDPYYGYPGQPCNQYRRGFQDVMQGTSITVKDGRGNVIAAVTTPPGVNVDTGVQTNSEQKFVVCEVTIPQFRVPDSDFYVFDFGRRGVITKSRQQMQESNWRIELSIGG